MKIYNKKAKVIRTFQNVNKSEKVTELAYENPKSYKIINT